MAGEKCCALELSDSDVTPVDQEIDCSGCCARYKRSPEGFVLQIGTLTCGKFAADAHASNSEDAKQVAASQFCYDI